MINSIQLQNFQSHKKSELKFHPGLNVVIGQSDTGKSSIIRALRWSVWNRPTGESFRSYWGGPTKVIISVDDTTITRLRSNSKNQYLLNTTELNAVGTDVPDEIYTALDINKVNLQQQLDRPFLLDDSPGEVASHFNQVAHLDVINSSMKNVQSWLRQLEQNIQSEEQRLQNLKENLTAYDYLDDLEGQITALEQIERRRSRFQDDYNQMQKLLRDIEIVEADIAEYQALMELEQPVIDLLNKIGNRDTLQEQAKQLHQLIQTIQDVELQIEDLKYITALERPVDIVIELYDEQEKLQQEYNTLSDLIIEIENTEISLQQEQEHLYELEQTFHEEMPDQCPLCGQEIPQ